MANIIKSIKGTRDFYPDEMLRRQWLIDQIRKTSESFGFQQYDGPCLESIDLYAAKSGEELVREQAFVFNDRGGDPITLRPELTPTLARMVAQKQNELFLPLRWWSFGPFWRYERPQKGRTREFFQWNVDLIGSDTVLADAELLAVAANFFRSVGVGSDAVKIHINDRQLMDEMLTKMGIGPEQKKGLLRMIDRLDKLPADIWREKTLELGLREDQLEAVLALLSDQNLWHQSARLCALFKTCEAMGVSDYLYYDPKIIRGLDYYTGLVFEAHDVKNEFRAILGGGRYANLVGDVGGNPLPGVGFAMGDVVILLFLNSLGLLEKNALNKNPIFVTIFDETTLPESCRLAAELRANGFNVIQAEVEKLAKQFKAADRLGAGLALVLGPDELRDDKVLVKNLSTHKQELMDRSTLLPYLKDYPQ